MTEIELPFELQMQIIENSSRKNFKPSEIIQLKKKIEKLKIKHRPKKGTKLSPLFKGKSADIVSKVTGVSRGNIQKIQAVIESDESRTIAYLDSGKISVNNAYNRIQTKQKKLAPTPNLPEDKFQVIVADVPWKYDFEGRGAPPYKTMSLQEIKDEIPALPAHSDCVLFLWVTNPKLTEGIELMKFWGFEFKTMLTWVKMKNEKLQTGTGYYARSASEHILIGTKGSITPLQGTQPPSVLFAERTQHSVKPDSIYDSIERMYPTKKKLEMFARKERNGWIVWGDEI